MTGAGDSTQRRDTARRAAGFSPRGVRSEIKDRASEAREGETNRRPALGTIFRRNRHMAQQSMSITDTAWNKSKSSSFGEPGTVSEQLFEMYLRDRRYEFCFEPNIEGKLPDFFVRWQSRGYLLELKQREGQPRPYGARQVQPCKGIRDKIKKMTKKTKHWKDFCCLLVLYNAGDSGTWLRPLEVYEAMLGNLGFTFPVGPGGCGEPPPIQNIFLRNGGSMVKSYRSGELCNRTISAIVILAKHTIPDERFERSLTELVRVKEAKLGRSLDGEELAIERLVLASRQPPSCKRVPRVTVCEHPKPRIPVPREMFTGPFDQRYTFTGDCISRIFQGEACTGDD